MPRRSMVRDPPAAAVAAVGPLAEEEDVDEPPAEASPNGAEGALADDAPDSVEPLPELLLLEVSVAVLTVDAPLPAVRALSVVTPLPLVSAETAEDMDVDDTPRCSGCPGAGPEVAPCGCCCCCAVVSRTLSPYMSARSASAGGTG